MYFTSMKGSLTATTSISSLKDAILKTILPIRPKPALYQAVQSYSYANRKKNSLWHDKFLVDAKGQANMIQQILKI